MRIANILISDAWGEVGPDAIERGIGGREGALIHLSQQWAKLGHDVTSFVNTNRGRRFYQREEDEFGFSNYPSGYHEYVPLNLTKPMLANFDWDVAIAWECPSVFDDEAIRERVGLKLCEMQVCHLSDKEMMATKNVDYMAVLSRWHAEFMIHSGVPVEDENFIVLNNGINIDRYPKSAFEEKLSKKIDKDAKFVYSSSPDRGLWYLLQSWPLIREEYKNAELLVGYGAEKWTSQIKWSHGRVGEMATDIEILMKQPGVIDIGKIGQDVLSRLQLEADAWLYPLDAQSPTESGCITAVENAAAGNPIITTDCDCMEEQFGEIGVIVDLPFDKDKYAEVVIDTLSDSGYTEFLRTKGREFAETRDWKLIARKWEKIFIDQN